LNNELPAVEPLLETLCQSLTELLEPAAVESARIVGVHTGGYWVAERLAEMLALSGPIGAIDIGFHRDDFDARGLPKPSGPTRLEGLVDGHSIILVDDVLHTGRTIRAAINAIFEYGRPGRILLATLVTRTGRQLPIQADAVGVNLDLPAEQRLKLSGPEPLKLALQRTAND